MAKELTCYNGSACIGEGYSYRVVAWLSIHVTENVAYG
jgi:hypothetical protein